MAQAIQAAFGREFSSVVLSGKTGSALPGSESAGLLKKNFHSVPASGLGLLAGRGCVLRKRPPEYWGESS
jgi:hypothetical protein